MAAVAVVHPAQVAQVIRVRIHLLKVMPVVLDLVRLIMAQVVVVAHHKRELPELQVLRVKVATELHLQLQVLP